MSIWKYHIISTLNWLVANNPLYKNIEINYCLLDILKNKFIPFGIIDNMLYFNPYHYKCVSYAINLCDKNDENNLNAAIPDIGIEGN